MGSEEEPSFERRVPGSRVKLWILLDANRLALAIVVLAMTFLALLALVAVEPARFERTVQAGDPIQTLFQALVTAIVTGVTVVVTINSLVLSQELAPVGEKQDHMEESTAFREAVADLTGTSVSPAAPSTFLRRMIEATAANAAELRAAVGEGADPAASEAITVYADHLERDAGRVARELENAEFGTFGVVAAALDFDYSVLLYEGKRLRRRHGTALDNAGREHLGAALELLERYGPAREHVKTLYFQWELVDLSRAMLYAAMPALVVSIASVVLLGDFATVPGTTLGLPNLAWAVCAAATVALAPFAILLSYILRVGTVAKRTLAIGPFVLRSTDDTAGPGDGRD